MKHLQPEKFCAFIDSDSVVIIDVRTLEEFNNGHIPNAINIDYYSDNFKDLVKGLDSLKPIGIYCRSGKRSDKSIVHFKEVGFKQIYNLHGGFLNWIEKDLPVLKSTSPF
ncbi:rhodanese-like domain-containing protein [Cognatitamlana onchidii]|uniref:rhodanese-like domain-containing protein n=1 Tax=Cognatitamlana onchidii TaxID=2562860 RepID=UPI001455F184|nr:rhodanese-like domain-containing protein [Algibacter onchidii]